MRQALELLYAPCPMELAREDDGEEPAVEFDGEVFNRAVEWIRESGEFVPEMLYEKPALDVIRETYRVFNSAVASSVKRETPEELVYALRNNAFVFSGFKAYHSLSELGLALVYETGELKLREEFEKEVLAIDDKYNRNYLISEYNNAMASSMMAARWSDFQQDGDRYDLQYRTANDDRVREAHQQLNMVTLSIDDPFWDQYFPPNGWNCRCTAVQVRKDKYESSDSHEAIKKGDDATAKDKEKIFRFNAGKELKLFPDKHPYYKAPQEAKTAIENLTRPIETRKDLEEELKSVAERTDWFARGFKQLLVEKRAGNNGGTDMNGTIYLEQNRLKNCIGGIDKLKKGEKITFEEADSMATLWHEIAHNRNKRGNMDMDFRQVKIMELANEFVARHTLPEFYRAFGSEIQHSELMEHRASTGYNKMVRSYQKLAELTKCDMPKLVDDVRKSLFNEEYTAQDTGLVSALERNQKFVKANGKKLTRRELTSLVEDCRFYEEGGIKKRFANLLVEKE